MTVNEASQGPTPDDLVELAMDIVNRGASSPLDREVIQKAFDGVQKIKRGPKGNYSANLRFRPLTVEKRDAAKNAAKHLKQALTALETWPGSLWAAGHNLSISEYDLAWLENMQRDLQIVGNTKLHGNSFDDRPLRAVEVAVRLLKAAGKDWSTTRDVGDADLLAAALWGTPNKRFEEHLLRFSHLPAIRRERAAKLGSVPG